MKSNMPPRTLAIWLLAGIFALPVSATAQDSETSAEDEEVFIVVPEEGDDEDDEQDEDKQADGLADEADEENRDEDIDAVQLESVEVRAERLDNVGGVAHKLDEEELERLEYDDPHAIL
jgi:hypothetical protein